MRFDITAFLPLLPLVLASPAPAIDERAEAANSYTVTAFTSPECSTSSTTFETLSGSVTSSCVLFPGGQSVNVILGGSCSTVTFFDGTSCEPDAPGGPDQTDVGVGAFGCQTFALNGQTASFNSFKVFC